MERYGWIKSIRKSKKITFVAVTDGKEIEFQVTIPNTVEVEGELKIGASFLAEGEDSKTPNGSYEFLASKFKIIGKSDDDFPIQPKEHSKEFLRSIPELRGRTREFQATWMLRSMLSFEIHRYLYSYNGFHQYFTPAITQSDCEGAGQTFGIQSDWLQEAYLTVSAQLQGEVGMMSLGKIYTFAPCFRAEKSSTKKHLAEFWMLEPEMAFYDLDKTMDLSEELVKYLLQMSSMHRNQLEVLKVDALTLVGLVEKKWKRITYSEIITEFGIEHGQDINSETEKLITDKYGPTFITHYPADLKPFYMKKKDGVANCFDLIFPEVGELIGGSEREEDYKTLKFEMEKSGINMEKMQWYLDTRRWGSVPHAGFGLGFERLIAFITKAEKVHDVIPFPVSYK